MIINDRLTMSVNKTYDYIGIGRTTIYDLINKGQLEAVKIGRRTLITTASIHKLLNQGQ
jgi:excisionase family DNA binding protein